MTFYGVVTVLALCGTFLAIALMILASLPHSPIRDLLVQIIGWLFAIFCGVYFVSPVDIVPEMLLGPFGLVDDVGAAIAGAMSAIAAWQAGESRASKRH